MMPRAVRVGCVIGPVNDKRHDASQSSKGSKGSRHTIDAGEERRGIIGREVAEVVIDGFMIMMAKSRQVLQIEASLNARDYRCGVGIRPGSWANIWRLLSDR